MSEKAASKDDGCVRLVSLVRSQQPPRRLYRSRKGTVGRGQDGGDASNRPNRTEDEEEQ